MQRKNAGSIYIKIKTDFKGTDLIGQNAESQGYHQDTGGAQRDPLNLDAAQQVAESGDAEYEK